MLVNATKSIIDVNADNLVTWFWKTEKRKKKLFIKNCL